jgi:hypothetical protein
MDTVADDIIIGWCDLDPRIRYRVAAAVVRLFKRPNDKAPYERASLTRQLLLKAPDPEAVFKEIVDRLHRTSWERIAGSSKPASRCSINSISTRSRSSRLPLMRPRRR